MNFVVAMLTFFCKTYDYRNTISLKMFTKPFSFELQTTIVLL